MGSDGTRIGDERKNVCLWQTFFLGQAVHAPAGLVKYENHPLDADDFLDLREAFFYESAGAQPGPDTDQRD